MMQSRSRVVVSGLGIVASVGTGVLEFWEGMLSGRDGFVQGTMNQAKAGAHLVAAVGGTCDIGLRDGRHARVLNRQCELLLAAAHLASRDAKLDSRRVPSGKLGVVVAVGPIE